VEKEYELGIERPEETYQRLGRGKSACYEDVERWSQEIGQRVK
jgi:hypothetical protein